MPKRIAVLGSFLVVLFMTTGGGVISGERRVRRYFGMPTYVGTVPEHVKAAILRQLPLGSSGAEVHRFLFGHGIGVDGVSICDGAPGFGRITCRMGPDHHPWELLREDCTVSFEFDDQQKLNNVLVRSKFSLL